jgi:hypothetical protein
MFSKIVTNIFYLAPHFITNLPNKTIIIRKNQVQHIADLNENFFAYFLVCWSYENGKKLCQHS